MYSVFRLTQSRGDDVREIAQAVCDLAEEHGTPNTFYLGDLKQVFCDISPMRAGRALRTLHTLFTRECVSRGKLIAKYDRKAKTILVAGERSIIVGSERGAVESTVFDYPTTRTGQ